MAANRLYFGDNLAVLRNDIASESVDLVYLDPPFNSNANYNVLFKSPTGQQSQSQIEAFEDTWHWGPDAEIRFDEVMNSGRTGVSEMLNAMRKFLGENDMMAYLTMMAVRLIELHRVLKPTGSLYLHCDPTASHYLKMLLDAVFGPDRILNEIIWKRTHAHGSSKRFGPVHDVILFYSKSGEFIWTDPRKGHDEEYVAKHFTQIDSASGRHFQPITLTGAGIRHGESGAPWKGIDPTKSSRHWALPGAVLERIGVTGGTVQERLDALDKAGRIYWPKKSEGKPRLKFFADELEGVAIPDVWTDIAPISAQAQERLGYPTQKPLTLLQRIILASSNEGDVVLDPFCGCGTAVHAAEKLKRRWIGIDVTHLAISLIEKRLNDAFPGIKYEVHGTPKDQGAAEALAALDKYQFQWWAVSLVNAQPFGDKKKGPDRGIDGFIYFKPDNKNTEKAIVSVKGGKNVGVTMVRELKAIIDREKAPIGVFISLVPPTSEMRKEAAAAGLYDCGHKKKYPRLQLFTIEELFAGKKPDIPLVDPTAAFKKAAKEERGKQGKLL